MKVLIAGGTGQIGGRLSQMLARANHEVTVLTRQNGVSSPLKGLTFIVWDAATLTGWEKLVEDADAVINLAGENIGGKPFTDAQLSRIETSRTLAGRALVESIRKAARRPGLFIQASAIGYYGTDRKVALDETSGAGNDFLAAICEKWEASTVEVESMGVRRVVIRSGLVLEKDRGVLPRMMMPFRFFAGGPLGDGSQVLSWIHMEDELNAIRFLLENRTVSGVYNLTAPKPVDNRQFGITLARVMKRPYWLPAPALALKLLLGRQSALVLEGQRVLPKRLLDAGYVFKHPELSESLNQLLVGSPTM